MLLREQEMFMTIMLILGSSDLEHYQKLKLIFDRIRQQSLKLNQSKCVFLADDLTYLGHKITSEGFKPDPSKIEAIVKIPNPYNKEEL